MPPILLCQAANGLELFHIFIIEQSQDGKKFNRGKLLNAGFDIARKDPRRYVRQLVEKPVEEAAGMLSHHPVSTL